MVAELLDNAAAYSDPETQVELSARFGDEGGLVVEIRDAGTGLRRPQLIDINQRLAVPSAIDVSVSRHMGLFVVGRLANRHGISVQLASSDGSGVTVTVALPKELITTEAASYAAPKRLSRPAGVAGCLARWCRERERLLPSFRLA